MRGFILAATALLAPKERRGLPSVSRLTGQSDRRMMVELARDRENRFVTVGVVLTGCRG